MPPLPPADLTKKCNFFFVAVLCLLCYDIHTILMLCAIGFVWLTVPFLKKYIIGLSLYVVPQPRQCVCVRAPPCPLAPSFDPASLYRCAALCLPTALR